MKIIKFFLPKNPLPSFRNSFKISLCAWEAGKIGWKRRKKAWTYKYGKKRWRRGFHVGWTVTLRPWEGAEEFGVHGERNTFHSRRAGRITGLSVHGGGNYLAEKEGKVVLWVSGACGTPRRSTVQAAGIGRNGKRVIQMSRIALSSAKSPPPSPPALRFLLSRSSRDLETSIFFLRSFFFFFVNFKLDKSNDNYSLR